MPDVRTAHTAGLDAATLAAARALLDQVFGDAMHDLDWDHALGGIHALAYENDELVGHASVIQRRLLHRGRALRAGHVEGVAVLAEHRRNGHGRAMMGALETVIRRAYEIGSLAATDEAGRFYAAVGWQVWQGPSSALTPDGVMRTADEDGSIFVLPVQGVPLDLAGELTCDWREGDLW